MLNNTVYARQILSEDTTFAIMHTRSLANVSLNATSSRNAQARVAIIRKSLVSGLEKVVRQLSGRLDLNMIHGLSAGTGGYDSSELPLRILGDTEN